MLALNSGHTVGKIGHPQLIRTLCHELAVYPVLYRHLPAAAGGRYAFTPLPRTAPRICMAFISRSTVHRATLTPSRMS